MSRNAKLLAVSGDAKLCEKCGVRYQRKYGESFEGWDRRKFCSPQCYGRTKRVGIRKKTCQTCNRSFGRPPYYSDAQWAKRRFCSKKCVGSAALSSMQREIWRRDGYREKMSAAHNPGQPNGRRGIRCPNLAGKKSGAWKGEKACYYAKHAWVCRHKIRPFACEECGVTGVRLEWSNVDHKYRRVLEDYRSLCKKCHLAYDATLPKRDRK